MFKLANSGKQVETFDTIGGGFGDQDMSMSSVESSKYVGMKPNSKMNFSMNMDRSKLQTLMSGQQTTLNSRNSVTKNNTSSGEKKSRIRIKDREITILQQPQMSMNITERLRTQQNNPNTLSSRF